MSESTGFGRQLTAERQAQGFKSQEHLDAFFAYYDHTNACQAECTERSTVWVHDGNQTVGGQCAEAQELFRQFVKEGDR